MKKNLPLLLASGGCLLSLLALGVAAAIYVTAGGTRLVYLNTNKLLDSYQAMVDARREYQREKQEWEQNLRTLAEEAQQAVKRTHPVGNTPVPQHLQQDAQLKQRQFLNYRQAVRQQDQQEMQRLTQPVVQTANRFIAAYSLAHHYDIVLTAAGQGDVVYATPALDVTAQVVTALNKQLADSLAQTSGHSLTPEVGKANSNGPSSH